MAFHGALHSLRSLSRAPRYPLSYLVHSPISSSLFSTLYAQSNSLHDEHRIKSQSTLDESFVLDQLSNLLPISRSNSSTATLFEPSNSDKQIEIRAVDGFLLPDEKLRGVFLQKLRGTAAIEHALDNGGVDLSVDVVAQVVNRGGLGAEAMLVFFNWAIRKPTIAKDIETYHIILKALGRRKFFTHMMQILHHMRAQGISPNLETISIVMDSFVRAQHVSKAIQMFRNLEEIGLECDTESLNLLLQCLCQRSHVGAANSFLNSVKGKIQFNGNTYNIIIGGWSRHGRVSEIERILEAMVADGFSADSSTFSFILEGLGRAGRIDDAVEIFDSMKGKGCMPDTRVYNAMISNFISVRNFDECVRYCKGMSSNSCDPNKTKPKTQRRRLLCTSQLAEYAPTTSAVYGFLLLSGGLFAYARSGSKGSILGGVSGAALMGTAYYLMQTPETKAIGDALGFGSAFLFASVFGIRLAATRKLAPAGPLLALSLSALAVFISAYLQDSH